MYGSYVCIDFLIVAIYSAFIKPGESRHNTSNVKLMTGNAFCVPLSHSGALVFLVQRAVKALQCLQGNVHPLLLPTALHHLLSLRKLPGVFTGFSKNMHGCFFLKK